MSKITFTNKTKGYTQIQNDLLNDPHISLKAKGMWAYLNSKPNDWEFAQWRMQTELKEGRDGIAQSIKELRGFKLLDVIPKKDKDFKMCGQEYILLDYNKENIIISVPRESRTTGKMSDGKDGVLYKEIVNKEIVNKETFYSNQENGTAIKNINSNTPIENSLPNTKLKNTNSNTPIKNINSNTPFILTNLILNLLSLSIDLLNISEQNKLRIIIADKKNQDLLINSFQLLVSYYTKLTAIAPVDNPELKISVLQSILGVMSQIQFKSLSQEKLEALFNYINQPDKLDFGLQQRLKENGVYTQAKKISFLLSKDTMLSSLTKLETCIIANAVIKNTTEKTNVDYTSIFNIR